MPCHNPIPAYRSRALNSSGKRSLVFTKNEGYTDLEISIPCGQCIGCRLERSREWALRITQEATLHKQSSFVTLTYEDRHLPPNFSLRKKDLQDFMKRLRFFSEKPLRYYACGEYGTTSLRPHYHICLFGEDFSSDRKHYKNTPDGYPLYNSKTLSERWTFGHAVIGKLNFETAAYTARYVTKKISGPSAREHYKLREAEFSLMSRRPGIGTHWLQQNISDIEKGFCWSNGGLHKTPKFYSKKLNQKIQNKLSYKAKKEATSRLQQKNPYTLDQVQKALFQLKKKKEI